MSFDAGAIAGKVILETNGFTAGKQQVEVQARQLADSIKQDLSRSTTQTGDALAKVTKDFRAQFKAARQEIDALDRKTKEVAASKADPFITLLKGAGAVAVVREVAREVERFGSAIGEAQAKIASGEVDIAEGVGELVRQTPLLGDFTKAFDAIRNAVTGASAELAKLNEESARMGKTSDAIEQILNLGKDARQGFADEGFTRDLDQELLEKANAQLAAIEAARQKRVTALGKGRDINSPQVQAEIAAVERASQQAADQVRSGLRGALNRRDAGRAAESAAADEERRLRLRAQEAERVAGLRQFQERVARQARDAGRSAAADSAGAGRGGGPNITVNAPGLSEDRLSRAISGHLAPVVENRVAQAESAARAARITSRVRRRL